MEAIARAARSRATHPALFCIRRCYRAGFASQPNADDRNDGLRLRDCFITAAVRCAPPKNKPTPGEMRNCFPYLVEEFEALQHVRVAVGLGSIGFSAILNALREMKYALEPDKPKFGHAVEVVATRGKDALHAVASYHPSQQNTNTGVLTVPDVRRDLHARSRTVMSLCVCAIDKNVRRVR